MDTSYFTQFTSSKSRLKKYVTLCLVGTVLSFPTPGLTMMMPDEARAAQEDAARQVGARLWGYRHYVIGIVVPTVAGYIYNKFNEKDKQYNQLLEQKDEMAALFARAKHGDAKAQYDHCNNYYWVEEDYKLAYAWCSMAAEQGNSEAQNILGDLYRDGRGVEKDYKKAAYWFTKAAEQGYSVAQDNLGDLYRLSEGVEKDYKKAAYWYTKATEQGNSWAQNSLGDLYESGKGVEQDYKKAAHWYTKAAEQGNSWAQNSLGDLYRDGQGVERDYKKAAYWYTKAAEQGHVDAPDNLKSLREERHSDL